jgi:hypothetical protein
MAVDSDDSTISVIGTSGGIRRARIVTLDDDGNNGGHSHAGSGRCRRSLAAEH